MKKNKILKQFSPQNLFFVTMTAGITIFTIQAFLTRGSSLSNVLHNFPNDTFMDFFNSIIYGSHPYENGVIYPPLANIFYALLGHFIPINIITSPPMEIRGNQIGLLIFVLYLIFSNIFFACLLCKFKLGSSKEKIFLLIIINLSLPFLYQTERANLIFLTLCFTLFFIMYYKSESTILKHCAFIALAIAAAFKIYPAIFGLLLLHEKRFKDCIICLLYGVSFFFLPILLLGGVKNLSVFFQNITNTNISFQNLGLGFKVNLTNTMQFFKSLLGISGSTDILEKIVTIIILLIGCILICCVKWNREWKVYIIPSLLIILIPGFSFVYSIIFLVIPLIKFLDEEHVNALDYIYMILFILAFIPLSIHSPFTKINENAYYILNISTVIESISILLLLLFIYVEGIYLLSQNWRFNHASKDKLV